MIDPFRLALALGPLAIYLVLLGAVNLSRRALVLNGLRDTAALGLALSGLLAIGPLELLMPRNLATVLGPYAWLVWLGFYAVSLLLLILVQRPRLTVYNLTDDELRPVLRQLVQGLDPEARWAGDNLIVPGLGVQLHVEGFAVMRNVSLTATGDRQSLEGWRVLEQSLAETLGELEVPYNPRGITILFIGLAMLAAVALKWIADPQAIAQGFRDMLRL